MKVKTLIKKLEKLNPNATVLVGSQCVPNKIVAMDVYRYRSDKEGEMELFNPDDEGHKKEKGEFDKQAVILWKD